MTYTEKAAEGALVLFPGGQDTSACLAWAHERYATVETLGFDYGQRHVVELECCAVLRQQMIALRPEWAARLGDDHTIELGALGKISETALTRDSAIKMAGDGLPNSFVPGRNIIFRTFAAALAYRRGLKHIVGGMCETDFSGYLDCRDDSVKALRFARQGLSALYC